MDIKKILAILLAVLAMSWLYVSANRYIRENALLKQVIKRLEADSRIAEVLVTGVNFDEISGKNKTTIKFLEYDTAGKPMEPEYFTFTGNIIQFQAYVIRFDDLHVRRGDRLKGRSAYLFSKVFMLDGKDTREYDITAPGDIPKGYRVGVKKDPFEERLWKNFWKYAQDPKMARDVGIKNAQIEAPGTMFIPGMLYTIKIEHDGGLRIDAQRLPLILKGERIPADKDLPISGKKI